MFLIHHCVIEETDTGVVPNWCYRPPTQQQATIWFKISQQIISAWWRNIINIFSLQTGSYNVENMVWMCEWHDMEMELFDFFLQQRQRGGLVRRGWFRRAAILPFKQCVMNHVIPSTLGPYCNFSPLWSYVFTLPLWNEEPMITSAFYPVPSTLFHPFLYSLTCNN